MIEVKSSEKCFLKVMCASCWQLELASAAITQVVLVLKAWRGHGEQLRFATVGRAGVLQSA